MSNYQSNHDTLEELEEEVLEQTSTQPAKSRTEMPSTLAEEVILIQTPSVTTKCANEEETMSYSYSKYNDESVTIKSTGLFLEHFGGLWKKQFVYRIKVACTMGAA